MSSRYIIEANGLEFDEGGNTLWVHGPKGTVLRIKCTGKIIVDPCSASCPHADMQVQGDIKICVPKGAEQE